MKSCSSLFQGPFISSCKILPYPSRFALYSNFPSTLVIFCTMTFIDSPTKSSSTVIVLQRLYYGNPPPAPTLISDDDIEQALALEEE